MIYINLQLKQFNHQELELWSKELSVKGDDNYGTSGSIMNIGIGGISLIQSEAGDYLPLPAH